MKEMISYEDFSKLDLRIATVISSEPVPKTDKLLKVELNIGEEETRTVVAGIRPFIEELEVGRQVLYLANLAPRKLRGIVSSGMILAAGEENEEGGLTDLVLLSPDKPVSNGAEVS